MKKKYELDRIDRICLYCKDYNKKHNTNYSYGQFVAKIKARKIRPLGYYEYLNEKSSRK